jgi:hypothetical protein
MCTVWLAGITNNALMPTTPHAPTAPTHAFPCTHTHPRWGKDTFDHIQGLVHSSAAATAGVSTVHATSLFRGPEPTPFWADITGGFCRLKPEELRLYSGSPDWADPFVTEAGGAAAAGAPQAWVDGYAFNSLLCEGRCACRGASGHLEMAKPMRLYQGPQMHV